MNNRLSDEDKETIKKVWKHIYEANSDLSDLSDADLISQRRVINKHLEDALIGLNTALEISSEDTE